MFWFKACPKCHGDLHEDADAYGSYIACLQCGHYLPEADETQLKLATSNLNMQPFILEQVEQMAA